MYTIFLRQSIRYKFHPGGPVFCVLDLRKIQNVLPISPYHGEASGVTKLRKSLALKKLWIQH